MTTFNSIAPVFLVADVGLTVKWYRETLDFDSHVFPETEPFEWASLVRGGAEIMLQRASGYSKPDLQSERIGGAWDAYLRVQGLHAIVERFVGSPNVMRGPFDLPYGCRELWVRDPNGYVLVISEDIQS